MAASAPNTPNTPDQRPTGDLEHLFRQKFADAEVAPRASFWDQLDHELVVQQNEQVVQENVSYRRRLVLHRWVAAACLLLALGVGSWAFFWNNGLTTRSELAAELPRSATPSSRAGASAKLGSAATMEPGADEALLAASGANAQSGASAYDAAGAPSTVAGSSAKASRQSGLGRMLAGLYAAPSADGNGHRSNDFYYGADTGTMAFARTTSSGATPTSAEFGTMDFRTAQLRSMLGLGRPDSLKPALLAVPQAPAGMELASVKEPTQQEPPKLWRRLRLGGSYAVGSYNPNINFSHADGLIKANPVAFALRNYYQDAAEDEYRRNLRAGISHRVAVTAAYALNDRWTLLSGAEVAEQRASSASTYGFVDGKQVGREAADIFNRPATNNSYLPPAQPRATSYRYRTATLPVAVQYGSSKPGLSLYAKVGAAVSLLLSSHSELEGSPEATHSYTLGSSDSPYRQVLTSVRGGAGVRYQPASATWSVAVGPTADAGLTTLNARPSQRVVNQSRPYSFGLEASVEFGSAKNQSVVAQ